MLDNLRRVAGELEEEIARQQRVNEWEESQAAPREGRRQSRQERQQLIEEFEHDPERATYLDQHGQPIGLYVRSLPAHILFCVKDHVAAMQRSNHLWLLDHGMSSNSAWDEVRSV